MNNTVKLSILLTAVLFSCVPHRILDETKSKLNSCESELAQTRKNAQECETKMAEMKEQMNKDQKALEGLRRDTSIVGSNYRNLTVKYDKLNQLNEQLMDKLNKLLAGSEKDNAKLSSDLQNTMEQLLKKQDELKLLEAKLGQQKKELEDLSQQLKQREARVNELENILKQKDKSVQDLKKKLQDALFNFENKGLTIQQKNGKIYVSMEENLLFASGKTDVNEKGVDALSKLAKVLEENPDINIMVEGHTDNVPMKGSGEIKDNWDLSVMRATSVTKIILSKGKIDPKRIVSAGRGEHFPLDPANTTEARRKNRRTEVILTPKLDELFKVLETN